MSSETIVRDGHNELFSRKYLKSSICKLKLFLNTATSRHEHNGIYSPVYPADPSVVGSYDPSTANIIRDVRKS